MRPLPGDDAFGRQRSSDHEAVNSAASNQMSFFLADEATVDSYLEQPSIGGPRCRDPRKVAEAGISLSPRKDDKDAESSRCASRQHEREREQGPAYSPMSRASAVSRSPAHTSSHNLPPLSRPMTPITLGTSCAGSVISSPSSRRNSLAGSLSEHVISSDEEEDHVPQSSTSNMMNSGSAPQLVMPSIKMPSRRPFTETGKNLGRLKVLIAGRSGVGKTSLVKAIVQTCGHIVHVDPIAPQASSSRRPSKTTERPSASRRSSSSTERISEIFASTKPYPEWWTELDQFRSSQRRKSLGDHVLERNICFVDTPGYGTGSSAMETIMQCVEYVESHLNKVSSDSLSEPEMLNMLGGGGGFQVDVVFYLIQRSLSPADLEYLRRLAPLTNIVPLLAQADNLNNEEQTTCKQQITGQLRDAGIRPFVFTPFSGQAPAADLPTVPYAVSSATGSDHAVMDASLLMSPDYVQPLISTELAMLVEQVFSPNGSSWLRHSAAKKYLQWRNSSNPSRPKHLYRPLSLQGPGPTFALARDAGTLIAPTSLALARMNRQPDELSPSRFEMVDWAADLQKSLASERLRYESVARGERAVWLTERLNECVKDGTLVAVNSSKETSPNRRRRGPRSKRTPYHQDPLGLLQVATDLKAKGWIALELLGSLGILGGLAFWITRQRWQPEPVQLADEWARMWGLDI
ncbi:hypothetical protein BJ170DRAFT_640718 [Xylariales sp. AK1849]|nr:hypothetical protein BJ170DRAFT_640718 [Xylariales sp. AK1849]